MDRIKTRDGEGPATRLSEAALEEINEAKTKPP
jgi:hypothetical protein